jgi:hypothetical protein
MRILVLASLLLFLPQSIFAQRRQHQRQQQNSANNGVDLFSSMEMDEVDGNNEQQQFKEESHLKRNLELWIRRRHQKREIGEDGGEADLEGQTCKIKVQKVNLEKAKILNKWVIIAGGNGQREMRQIAWRNARMSNRQISGSNQRGLYRIRLKIELELANGIEFECNDNSLSSTQNISQSKPSHIFLYSTEM